MTPEEATANIGKRVEYRVFPLATTSEFGVITEVRSNWVFVRYDNDSHAKATAVRCLTLAGDES